MDRDSDFDKHLVTMYYLPLTLSLTSLLSGLYLALRGSYGINFLHWGFIATGLFLLAIFIVVDREISGSLTLTERQFMKIHFYGLLVAILALMCLMIAAFNSININPDASDGPDFFHMWGRTRVREYDIIDYDCELRRRMANKQYWGTIAAVLRQDHVCDGMQPLVRDPNTGAYYVDWPSKRYPYDAGLSPIESGCCKPPLSCEFTYVNQTTWTRKVPGTLEMVTNSVDNDCGRWSNDQQTLCFQCDSCKAGVLADIQRIWSTPVMLMTGNILMHAIVLPFVVKVLKFRKYPLW